MKCGVLFWTKIPETWLRDYSSVDNPPFRENIFSLAIGVMGCCTAEFVCKSRKVFVTGLCAIITMSNLTLYGSDCNKLGPTKFSQSWWNCCCWNALEQKQTHPHFCVPSIPEQSKFCEYINCFVPLIHLASDKSYDLGDFNLPDITWINDSSFVSSDCGLEPHFVNLLSVSFFYQVIKCPARGNNILDLVLTNHSVTTENFLIKNGLPSDHISVYLI